MFISLLKSCCTLLQSIDFEARNTQDGLSVSLRQFLPAVKVFADWMACHADLWQASSIRLLALLNIFLKVNLFHVTWNFIWVARIARRMGHYAWLDLHPRGNATWLVYINVDWVCCISPATPVVSSSHKPTLPKFQWRGAWTKALTNFLSNTKFFFWLSSIYSCTKYLEGEYSILLEVTYNEGLYSRHIPFNNNWSRILCIRMFWNELLRTPTYSFELTEIL